jgi:ABC-2 type transport system permease protein
MKEVKINQKVSQVKATLALARASFFASIRNPSTIFFSFLFPFIFIVVFGLIGRGSVSFEVALRSNSLKEGPVYESLDKIEALDLITDKSDDEIDEGLKKGQIPVALTINQEENKFVVNAEKSAGDPQNANTVMSIINTVISQINNPENGSSPRIVNINETVVEGRKYEQIDFILPGQLAFALLSTGVFGIAFTFISLKKELVIKRIFATPASKWSIMFGEVISKMITAIMQSLLIILVGKFLFGFTLANGVETLIYLIILSLLGLGVFFGFGLFVSSLGKDEDSIAPIANLITLPQFLLSGAFFPTDAFPSFLQPVSKVLPMTFLNNAMRAVAFEGDSIIEVLPQLAGLLVWGVIIYVLVVKLFKWE